MIKRSISLTPKAWELIQKELEFRGGGNVSNIISNCVIEVLHRKYQQKEETAYQKQRRETGEQAQQNRAQAQKTRAQKAEHKAYLKKLDLFQSKTRNACIDAESYRPSLSDDYGDTFTVSELSKQFPEYFFPDVHPFELDEVRKSLAIYKFEGDYMLVEKVTDRCVMFKDTDSPKYLQTAVDYLLDITHRWERI